MGTDNLPRIRAIDLVVEELAASEAALRAENDQLLEALADVSLQLARWQWAAGQLSRSAVWRDWTLRAKGVVPPTAAAAIEDVAC